MTNYLEPAHTEHAPEPVTISVTCDGLTEYATTVEANEVAIAAELQQIIPWFTGRDVEYSTALIDQLAAEGSFGHFVVNTDSHGPVTFDIS